MTLYQKKKKPGHKSVITLQKFQQIYVDFGKQKWYEETKIETAVEGNETTKFARWSKEEICEQGPWTTAYKKPTSKGKIIIL